MRSKPIYVKLDIRTDMDTLWDYTQTPELHEQWDLRFSRITYLPREQEEQPQRFCYQTRIGFGLAIAGTGLTKARRLEDGGRISTLLFGSDQAISLIREGRGYWKYTPLGEKLSFETQYDYETRFGRPGRWFDRTVFRPLFGWATAWSFDALRIWVERGIPPAASIGRAAIHYVSVLLLTLLWCWQGLVPKLLYPEGGELALLQASGLFPGWERPALALLGFAEIGIGLMTAACHRQTWIWRGQAILVLLLVCAALAGSPELIKAPFNPLTLSAAMIGLGVIAAVSNRDLPRASRCARTPSRGAAKGGKAHGGVDL
ncbi:DoxX-like family protein [Paenibacillus thiaminolyticus]|uniref:DoxX-like family protein n=1 Tax=Paenibacillus thiaminolyticus TaxID=49283 RepID=UPI0025428575|nr:DoxX-like family protein [Paenibacillus thiaminolyticus]WII40418.1 DoxX-like family protein [Paenibacillus thiaminolyticus]